MRNRAIASALTIVVVITGGFLISGQLRGMGLDFSASLLHSELIVIIVMLAFIYMEISLRNDKR